MLHLTAFVAVLTVGCDPSAGARGTSPYAAPADAEYSAEDVVFSTRDGRTLAGTLTVPPGGDAPAVVMITGSGLQDRDEHIRSLGPAYRPFRQIADTLSRRGVATLRLDDPGVGGSDPFPPDATPFTYGDDIRAALDFLRTRPEIDAQRLAVLGHSEGAVVAPYVAAADSGVRAMVLLAAPAYTLARVNRFQRATRFERGGMSAQEVQAEVERTERASELAALRDPWRGAAWVYDPLPTARSVSIPVLLLHGAEDFRVTPEQSDTLAAAFKAGGNPDVTVRIFPNRNHFFLPSARDPASTTDQVDREVLGTVADWLASRLLYGGAG